MVTGLGHKFFLKKATHSKKINKKQSMYKKKQQTFLPNMAYLSNQI